MRLISMKSGLSLSIAMSMAFALSMASDSESKVLEPDHPGIVAAEAKTRVMPDYPCLALTAGGPEASVTLRLEVKKSCKIGKVTVLDSSLEDLGFEEEAMAVATRWRYRPARLDGKKVASHVYVRLSFTPFLDPSLHETVENATRPDNDARRHEAAGEHPAVLIEKNQPAFPPKAKRSNFARGEVEMFVLLGADGIVKNTCVTRSSPPGVGFAEAAVASAQKWRYKPAQRDGKPVPIWQKIKIEFQSDVKVNMSHNRGPGPRHQPPVIWPPIS